MTNQNEPWKVLQKDGISYVEIARGYSQRVLINDEPAVLCPGNDKWAMVEGDVHSIHNVSTARGEVIGYQLAERYKGLVPNLPETQPLDAFEYADCGGITGELSEFYVAVYGESTETLEPREWLVVDMNCEPVQMPPYVQVQFPAYLKEYPQTWHKHPCFISAEAVFDILWDKLTAIIDSSEGRYSRDNYKNIYTLAVSENVPVNYELYSRVVTRVATPKRAEKFKMVKRSTIKVPVFHIALERKSYTTGAVLVKQIHGDYLDNLLKNLDDYIQEFADLLDSEKCEMCPHCEGSGIVTIGGNA